MATIKGQNLRILVSQDGMTPRCIAAALQCTVHAALQLQEDTTKDTDNDWINQEPVGVNWDVSAESVVLDGVVRGAGVTSSDIGGISPVPYFGTVLLTLPAGKTITARSLNYHGNIIIGGTPPISSALATGTEGSVSYTNSGSSSMSVVVGTPYNDAQVEWFITEDANATYVEELTIGAEYDLLFSITKGAKNREVGSVTKASITASWSIGGISPIPYYGPSTLITLPAGKAITAKTMEHHDLVIVGGVPPITSALAQGDNGQVTYTNETDSDMSVIVGCPYEGEAMDYYIHDPNTMQCEGNAILNDIDYKAPNQDMSTAALKFTGNGELTLLF